MTNLSKLFDSLQKNIVFVLVSLVLMAVVYFIAFGFEKLIEKKNYIKFSSEKTRVNKMVIMAMLAAISVILMYFEFPLTFIAPSFYEIDLSEVPVLIGSFLLGPCAGVVIEAVKVILKVCIKGTTTAFQVRSHGDVPPGGALPNRPLERQQEPRHRPGVLGAEKGTGRAGQAERPHDCRRYHAPADQV